MSEAESRSAVEELTLDAAYYVYCVGSADELQPLSEEDLPPPIEPERERNFIFVNRAGLTALASRVPLADYSEEALSARLEDATWTALRAMRHERVVEFMARTSSVVPLRFGTIYLTCAAIEEMLDEKREELLSIIERLRGREEWGVNVYCDRRKLLENIVSLSPRLRALEDEAVRATPGQCYLMRKKIEAMRADEARAEIKRVSCRIEERLSEESDGAARLRVLKDEATEHGETVAKFAFLVSRERFNDFRAAAEKLADENIQAGFKLELTGPWPAYNFT